MQPTPKSLVRLAFGCDFDYGYDHGCDSGCDCGLYLDLDGVGLIADGHQCYDNLLTDARNYLDVIYASWVRRYHVDPNDRRVILCDSCWRSYEIFAFSMVVQQYYRHLGDLVWGVVQGPTHFRTFHSEPFHRSLAGSQ